MYEVQDKRPNMLTSGLVYEMQDETFVGVVAV